VNNDLFYFLCNVLVPPASSKHFQDGRGLLFRSAHFASYVDTNETRADIRTSVCRELCEGALKGGNFQTFQLTNRFTNLFCFGKLFLPGLIAFESSWAIQLTNNLFYFFLIVHISACFHDDCLLSQKTPPLCEKQGQGVQFMGPPRLSPGRMEPLHSLGRLYLWPLISSITP